MAKNHGAKQQKKVAKQRARRAEKRSEQFRRTSPDPTIRLKDAAKWPVVEALMVESLWEKGLGTLVLARRETAEQIVFAVFLVDVYCLGVKNAFWKAGTPGELKDLLRKIEKNEPMTPIDPACLVKIVKGAVEYARAFGYSAHPDYRHAAMLLEGIDPANCSREFTFGKDGKPFYIRGPKESLEQARAISERVREAGGHFIVALTNDASLRLINDDEDDNGDDGENPVESGL